MFNTNAKRYFPEGSIIVRPKAFPGTEIGLYSTFSRVTEALKYGFIAYRGKAKKPTQYFTYNTAEARDRAVANFYDGLEKMATWKAEQRAKRVLTVNPVQVGFILVSSWGYDQTNVDFYQVVSVKGAMVEMRPIASKVVDGSRDFSGHVVAVKDAFIEDRPIMRKKVQTNDNGQTFSISLNSYTSAYLWDGKPRYESHYA